MLLPVAHYFILYNIILEFTTIKLTYHPKLDKIYLRMGDYMKIRSKPLIVARILLALLTLSLIVFIFSNSAQTAEVSSASSGRIMAFLNSICSSLKLNFTFTQSIVRTLAHFAEFGLLGVLSVSTFLSVFGVKAKTLILSVLLSVSTAIIDECIQLFSDGRAFQFSDLVIDFTGSLLGIVGVFLIALLINNHKIKVQRRKSNGKCNEE